MSRQSRKTKLALSLFVTVTVSALYFSIAGGGLQLQTVQANLEPLKATTQAYPVQTMLIFFESALLLA